MRDAAERARIADRADRQRRRLGPAREQGRRIEELVHRIDQHDAFMLQHGAHHLIIAGEAHRYASFAVSRALAVRPGCSSTIGLALAPRAAHEFEEQRRTAYLLDEEREDAVARLVEAIGEKILDAEIGFVAGRDRASDRHAFGQQRQPQIRSHRAALRDHRRAFLMATAPARRPARRSAPRHRRNCESRCNSGRAA